MNYIKSHWFGLLFWLTVFLTIIIAGLYIALFKFYGVNGQLEVLGTIMAKNDKLYYILMSLGLISSLISMFLFTYLMYFKQDLVKLNKIIFNVHLISTVLVWTINIAITASTSFMMICFGMAFVYMVLLAMWQEKHSKVRITANERKETITDKNVKIFKKAISDNKKESDVKNDN